MAMTRRPTNSTSLDEDLERYSNYLTTYAFQHVQKQVQLAKQVKVKQTLPNNQFVVEPSAELSVMVTPDQCGCNYGTKIGLPCRHILKVRSIQKLPLFDEALVAKRWSSSYYRESAVGRFEVLESQSQESNDITTIEEDGNKEKILSEAQKYRKALKVAQILASTACEGGMRTFNVRFAQMQKLLDSWQTSKVLCLEDISDKVAHSHVVTRPTDRKPILSDVLTKKVCPEEENDEIDLSSTSVSITDGHSRESFQNELSSGENNGIDDNCPSFIAEDSSTDFISMQDVKGSNGCESKIQENLVILT